jgi:hypothetical protein
MRPYRRAAMLAAGAVLGLAVAGCGSSGGGKGIGAFGSGGLTGGTSTTTANSGGGSGSAAPGDGSSGGGSAGGTSGGGGNAAACALFAQATRQYVSAIGGTSTSPSDYQQAAAMMRTAAGEADGTLGPEFTRFGNDLQTAASTVSGGGQPPKTQLIDDGSAIAYPCFEGKG